jgi:ribose transport system permease protein
MSSRITARRGLGLDRFSGLYLWAMFIIAFSIWSPSLFPTLSTVHSVASGQAVTGMLALAVLVPLVAGVYDLSIGSTANLTGILAINLQVAHRVPMALAIVLSVLVGVAIGAVNGFVVVKLKVNSFIATLGMGSIVLAVLTIVSGNIQPVPPTSSTWAKLTQQTIGGFQIAFLYLIIIAIIVWWVLEHMPSGRYLFSIGSNTEAARLSGVAVGTWTWISLMTSGGIAAIAGVVFGSLLGPSLTFGQGLLLPAFAAAFLGSTQLRRGRFNVWGTMIAIYVLATGVQGFSYVTGVQWLSDMFNGVALIAAVAFAVWRQHATTRTRAVAGPVAEPPSAELSAPGPDDDLAPVHE